MKQHLSYIYKKLYVLIPRVPSILVTLIFLNNTVIVQWLPNSERDLAGYKLYYGTATRAYSEIIPVGLATQSTISNLKAGYEYFFAVTAYDTAGNESQFSEEVSIFITGDDENLINPDHKNGYNFPNPFNPEIQITQIRYHLPKSEDVTIVIFDVSGNEVRTLLKNVLKNAGEHIEDSWDGKDENGNLVPNGIYYALVSSKSLDHYITIAVTR